MSPTNGQPLLRPVPPLPRDLAVFDQQRAVAHAKYRPTLAGLGHGELFGLSDAVADELARRREAVEALLPVERKPGTLIGR